MIYEESLKNYKFVNGKAISSPIKIYVVDDKKFISKYEAMEYDNLMNSQDYDISNIKSVRSNNVDTYNGIWYFIKSEDDVLRLRNYYKKHEYCSNIFSELKMDMRGWVLIDIYYGDNHHAYVSEYNDIFEAVEGDYEFLIKLKDM